MLRAQVLHHLGEGVLFTLQVGELDGTQALLVLVPQLQRRFLKDLLRQRVALVRTSLQSSVMVDTILMDTMLVSTMLVGTMLVGTMLVES